MKEDHLPRAITPEEAAIIRAVLELGAEESFQPEVMARLPSLQVIAVCQCGCPSVEFEIFDFAEKLDGVETPYVLAEALGTTSRGGTVEVSIWGWEDRLHCLDIVELHDEVSHSLPTVVSIRNDYADNEVRARSPLTVRALVFGELEGDVETVLLVRQTYMPGWRLPGGMVRLHEDPETALRRALFEEVGIVPNDSFAPAPIFSSWHTAVYSVRVWQQQPQRWEVAEITFARTDRLPRWTTPFTRRRIRANARHRRWKRAG